MKKFLKTFSFFFFFSISVFSQTDSVKTILNEIVITATKSETPYYQIGSSMSIINSDLIQQKQLKTIVDVLKEIPGLSVTQLGGPGKQTSVFMRGTNSNHVLVILDGVELNDPSSPSNAFDFSSLNVFDISRIEVVRGSQSTLYGSDAIGGVINIITKKGNDKPQYYFEGEAGSNNYYRSSLSALGSYDKLNYSVFASRSESKGISAANSIYGNNEKDGFANTNFSANLEYNFIKNWKANFTYRFLKSNADLDQNNKFGDDPNYTFKQEEHIMKINLSSLLFDGLWKQDFSVSQIRRFSNAVDLPDAVHKKISSDSYANGSRFKVDWQNNLYIVPQNILTFGFDNETEKANSSYNSNSDWGPFNSVFPNQSTNTLGIYLQDQFEYDKSFFLTAGMRYDSHKKFGSVTTFRIAPVYFVKETNTKIRSSYGTGFKAPSLYYLFDPAFGNPELKPEKSKSFDIGIDQFFNNGNNSLSITYFINNIQDMFGFDKNFKTVNIAKAKTSGVEFIASAKINEITLTGNYTYTNAIDDYELSPEYKQELLRRPKNQFYFYANYNLKQNFDVNLSVKYVGKRIDKDFSSFPAKRITLPDYTLINLATSYKVNNLITIYGRIENLFDKKYEDVLYYGTLGRSFYLGVDFSL